MSVKPKTVAEALFAPRLKPLMFETIWQRFLPMRRTDASGLKVRFLRPNEIDRSMPDNVHFTVDHNHGVRSSEESGELKTI
jgi:hypothetical protein